MNTMPRGQSSAIFIVLIVIVITAVYFYTTGSIEGSGNVISDDREIEDFEKVVIAVPGTYTIVQGSNESLTVRGDDNIIEKIETVVKGDTLLIRWQNRLLIFGYRHSAEIFFDLGVEKLTDLSLTGSGDITATNIEGGNIDLSVNGNGTISMQIAADTLETTINGSGNIELYGLAKTHDVEISGTTTFDALNLETHNTTIDLSGSGSVDVYALNTLDVKISGQGTIRYLGNPEVTEDISGSAKVERITQ